MFRWAGLVVGLEFDGAFSCDIVNKAVADLGEKVFVSPDTASAQKMADEFFAEIVV